MKYETHMLVYPEGDEQEVGWHLRFNQIVDVAGRPLSLPLTTVRILAFRVFRITNEETRNEHVVRYHLEQLYPEDLAEYALNTR